MDSPMRNTQNPVYVNRIQTRYEVMKIIAVAMVECEYSYTSSPLIDGLKQLYKLMWFQKSQQWDRMSDEWILICVHAKNVYKARQTKNEKLEDDNMISIFKLLDTLPGAQQSDDMLMESKALVDLIATTTFAPPTAAVDSIMGLVAEMAGVESNHAETHDDEDLTQSDVEISSRTSSRMSSPTSSTAEAVPKEDWADVLVDPEDEELEDVEYEADLMEEEQILGRDGEYTAVLKLVVADRPRRAAEAAAQAAAEAVRAAEAARTASRAAATRAIEAAEERERLEDRAAAWADPRNHAILRAEEKEAAEEAGKNKKSKITHFFKTEF